MKRIFHGLLLLGTVLLIVLGYYISKDYHLPQFENKQYVEPSWNLTDNNTGKSAQVTLPQTFKYTGSNTWILSTTLTYTPEDTEAYPSLFLSTNHSYFRVFLDNALIYSYDASEIPNLSKSPGNVYTAVSLPRDCTGKELQIEFTLTLEDGLTYELGDIFFGDYPSVMHNLFYSSLFHNILVICILFVGIVLLVLSLLLLQGEGARDAYWIGFFAILFAIYSFSESLFTLYITANPYIAYLINFIVFAALPLPLIMFFMNKIARKFVVFYHGVSLLIVSNIILQCILHFCGIRDLRQMLLFTHLSYALTFTVIFTTILLSKKEECPNKRFLFTLMLPLIAGGILDALTHYIFLGKEGSNTAYSQLGVLFTLVFSAAYAIWNVLQLYKESINAKVYKELALKDGLTGLLNRAAYNNELSSLSEEKNSWHTFTCVCVDINNLKQTNDTSGHRSGDLLILSTAGFLQDFFGSYGKIFRIGGDEFTVFLYDVSADKLTSILYDMYRKLKTYNQTAEIPISFALGHETIKASENVTENEHQIEDCIRSADKKMYMDKVNMKKQSASEEILQREN